MKILEKFQKGYTDRNIEKIDVFVNELFVDSDETIIIGTGDGEWCKGIDQIKELLYIDWFYWGNFKLDLYNALVKVFESHATVSTTAILQKVYEPEKLKEICINRMKNILDSEEQNKDKIYLSLKAMSYFLHEEQVGVDTKRKIRFSASLLKENDTWKFSDIHFSYPVSPPTDIKIISE